MKALFTSLLLIAGLTFYAQNTNINKLKPEKKYDNILIKKMHSDKNATVFVIWIKDTVKSHKHALHSENILVVEGTGIMKIGDKTLNLEAGDYFIVPQNTYHSLKVTSKTPMKVISVQSPEFLGKDRVFEITKTNNEKK